MARAGPLSFVPLFTKEYLEISHNQFTESYRKCTFNKAPAIFMGNYNSDGKPDGIVRVIGDLGFVYEGNTKDGLRHGWGRFC